jgi:hypothetical protein
MPALKRLRQKDHKFKARLNYQMSLRPAWTTQQDPVSKIKKFFKRQTTKRYSLQSKGLFTFVTPHSSSTILTSQLIVKNALQFRLKGGTKASRPESNT